VESQESRLAARRRRHRDLPAAVRRRQAIAAAVVVLVVVVALYALISSLTGGGGKSKSASAPVEKLVGQSVIGKVGASGPDKALLKRVRAGRLGGVVMFPNSEKRLREETAALQKAAEAGGNPPLLIAIDQEGGPVKRLPGPPKQSPAELGKSGDEGAARSEGEDTGKFLSGLGINADLAPDADVSHPGTAKTLAGRTFGTDPGEVAKLATAFAEGLDAGGAKATVKHFPGLGFAKRNPDTDPVKISASRAVLDGDVEPFKSAIDAGVPLVMMSTAIYPAYGSNDPAAWAEPIIGGELRDKLGFDGVVITDDLEGAAVRKLLAPDKAALRSLTAGADMVMFATGTGTSDGAYRSLLKSARKGKLPRTTLEASYKRILALKDGLGS
jgi:beta-N-acetylhexosaminidase